jgi:hypothetical protein
MGQNCFREIEGTIRTVPTIDPWNVGTLERRNVGTLERRNAGTSERSDARWNFVLPPRSRSGKSDPLGPRILRCCLIGRSIGPKIRCFEPIGPLVHPIEPKMCCFEQVEPRYYAFLLTERICLESFLSCFEQNGSYRNTLPLVSNKTDPIETLFLLFNVD